MQPLVAKNIKSVIILTKFLILSHHSFKKIEEIELVVYERPSQCCWRTLHSLVIWNNFTLHFSAWQLHNNPERCWLKTFIQLISFFLLQYFQFSSSTWKLHNHPERCWLKISRLNFKISKMIFKMLKIIFSLATLQ